MAKKNNIKVSGYAQRVFFNNNIEYRDFSDNLVGLQLTSVNENSQFTMGNFTITTNIDPKVNKIFNSGVISDFYTLESIGNVNQSGSVFIDDSTKITKTNIDITKPLGYVYFGSFSEYLRVSTEDIIKKWTASLYITNIIGTITGNNITNYVYSSSNDISTITISTNYFTNPYSIIYSKDASLLVDPELLSSLRNFTVNYGSYVIDYNNVEYAIKSISASTRQTNDIISLVVNGNPFSEITGTTGSIKFHIKPNEQKREEFFSNLNEFQSNLLNRLSYPEYTSNFNYEFVSDQGTLFFDSKNFTWPVISGDNYNLDVFTTNYESFYSNLSSFISDFDLKQTNIINRKLIAEAIISFDTVPSCGGDDLTNNGQKATKLLNIYGRSFDEYKKWVDTVKFAHVVTYNKRNNLPDPLVKELSYMLGLEKLNFLPEVDFSKLMLPSNGQGNYSGSSRQMTLKEVDVELYRRIILNIAWLWKSKGTRKAIEFLFRLIGAPEALVNFDEYIYVVDKPINVEEVKRLLYIFTGEADLTDPKLNLPFDENGYPLPPINGQSTTSDLYYQSNGGWYVETGGSATTKDVYVGNNPHIGPYDGGNSYLNYFTNTVYIPNFNNGIVSFTGKTYIFENLFLNYNKGLVDGLDENYTFYGKPYTLSNVYINPNYLKINKSLAVSPEISGYTSQLKLNSVKATEEYNKWINLIKENPFKAYDPEWEFVKTNKEAADANYFSQESVLDPNIIDKHIEICLDKIEVVDSNICLDYTYENGRLKKDGPYLVFYDEFDVKTTEIPVECCYSNGGKIITVTDTKGFNYQYCVLSNPCDGYNVNNITDGIVYWEISDLTKPLYDGQTTITVEVCPECCAYNNYEYGEINLNASNNDYFNEQKTTTTNIVFGCKTTSTVTYGINNRFDLEDYVSPYGSYDSNVVLLTNEPTDCNVIRQSAGYKINDISNQTSSSQYGTNQTYGNQEANPTCDSLITSINNKTGVVTLYNDTTAINIGSTQYSNCCKAKGFEIRCYDVPYYVKNKIYKWVDCNTLTSSSVSASFDNDVYVQYGKKAASVIPKNYNFKCVDPRIADLTDNSVKIIMGVNEWNGVTLNKQLSENETCDYEINVDFLLKYDADSLLSCSSVKKTCTPSFEMYKNTISEAGGSCFKNFIVFVNDESDVVKLKNNTSTKDYNNIFSNNDAYSSFLDLNVQNTYEGPEFKQGWYDVKQLEPSENKECCEAYGGNVITKAQWVSIYENKNSTARFVRDSIFKNYDRYKLGTYTLQESYNKTIESLKTSSNYDNSLTLDSYQKIGEYGSKLNELTGRNSWRDIVNLISCNFDLEDTCLLTEINWNKVVPTNNVCSITTPVTCDVYGALQIKSWLLIGELQQAYDITKQCIDNKNKLLVNKQTAEVEYNSLVREKSLLTTEYISKQTIYNTQKQICSEQISTLQDEIIALEEKYVINNCNSTTTNTTTGTKIGVGMYYDDTFNINDVEVVVNFAMTDPCWTAPIGCPYTFKRDVNGNVTIKGSNSTYSCGCKGYVEEGSPNSIVTQISNLGFCKGDAKYCTCCKTSDIVEDLYVATTTTTTDPTVCNKIKNDIVIKKNELDEKSNSCTKIDEDFNLVTEEYITKLESINTRLLELNDIINSWNEQLNTDFNCCDEQLIKLKSFIDESIKNKETIKKYSNECLDAWHNTRMESYSDFISQNSVSTTVFNLIDEAKVYLTLEVVDKTSDPSISNTTTILNPNKINLINESYWVFSATNEYTGVVIEGENDVTIKQVKKSLLDEIKNKYGSQYGTLNTFEPKWQHLKLPISNNLVNLYKDREFKFGIVVDNYECDVCLKIDTIQINRNCDNTKIYSNTETCPTFDLTCVKDNKRSWLFKNDGIQVIKDNDTLETSINIINTENRLWSDLEYRYTNYGVNHDDLIVNSKSTIFRIDPAKAIECDVYDYYRSVSGCSYTGYYCKNTFVDVTCGSETITECICVDTFVNIDPLNYLDTPISEMTTKESIDEMISSNLIDVKSRQVLNGYPMLELFVWLYLNPNNCGGVSGQLNYSNLFQFMDLVGDYWMDLIEQVVPATTIWDGCENSGKIYRNTIFDRDKYNYKRYVLESDYNEGTCRVVSDDVRVIGINESYYDSESLCNSSNGLCNGVDEYYMTNEGKVIKIEKEIKIDNTYSNVVYIQHINDSNEYVSYNISIDNESVNEIIIDRDCNPITICDDQKQFQDNNYFEFMDDSPYYFMG